MPTSWQATDLSVSPPSYQLADTDKVALSINAQEAITTATAELIRLDTLAVMPAGNAVVTPGASSATVVVSGLARGVTYELAVTFTRADTTKWTRTLVLECVA